MPRPNIIKSDILTCEINGMNRFDAIVTDPPYGLRASARKATKSTTVQ